jgi:hypothetical protein
MFPIDFLYRLHFIGQGSVAIYKLTDGVAPTIHATQLFAFNPRSRHADVIWDPTAGELFVPGLNGGNTCGDVS